MQGGLFFNGRDHYLLDIFVITLSFYDLVYELLKNKNQVLDKFIAFIILGAVIGLLLLSISIGNYL